MRDLQRQFDRVSKQLTMEEFLNYWAQRHQGIQQITHSLLTNYRYPPLAERAKRHEVFETLSQQREAMQGPVQPEQPNKSSDYQRAFRKP